MPFVCACVISAPLRETHEQLIARFFREEEGGEVLEYALIVGLLIVGAVATISTVGTKILARWTSLNNSM